jgi:hypothetical protein
MKLALQNRFDGGIAEDLRTNASNECELATGFDLMSNPYKLIHHIDPTNELNGAETINDNQMTDVGMTTIAGNAYMVAFGKDSAASNLPASFIRTPYEFNGFWEQQAVGVLGTNFIKGTYVQYGGISFILTNNGTTYNLQKYTTSGTMTSVGSFTVTAVPAIIPRPYIHPEDKVLYMAVGTVIATYNIATGSFQALTTLLPTGYMASTLAHYGGYLTIGVVPDLPGDSLMLLWARDITLNTLQGSVNMGRLYLQTLQNIEGVVIAICRSVNTGGSISKTIEVKAYFGGDSYQLLKTVEIPGALGIATNYNIVSCRKDDSVYFAVGGEKAIYRVCKNKSGRWVISQDRLIAADGGAVDNVFSLAFVGDYLYCAYQQSSTYKLSATNDNASKNLTATYIQSVNCNMTEGDKSLEKKILHIEVLLEGISTSGTSTLKYIVDGITGTVQSKTNTVGNFVLKGKAEYTGTPFKSGRDIQIQVETTYGTNVKEIRYFYQPINLI